MASFQTSGDQPTDHETNQTFNSLPSEVENKTNPLRSKTEKAEVMLSTQSDMPEY